MTEQQRRLPSASMETEDFPRGSEGKASACSVGDLGSIPGSGRSSGEEMATHSGILAWKIPWMEEPGGLQSVGSQRVRQDWVISLSLSMEIEPHAAIAIDLQQPLREFRVESGTLCSRESGGIGF